MAVALPLALRTPLLRGGGPPLEYVWENRLGCGFDSNPLVDGKDYVGALIIGRDGVREVALLIIEDRKRGKSRRVLTL